MAKEILNYTGLFGDHAEHFKQKVIHHEPIHTRTKLYNYEITEHLHPELYQLFIITSGGGLLLSSNLKIPLESPCVLMIPSHRIHGFVFQSDIKGDVITIQHDFFEKIIENNSSQFSTFNELQYISLAISSDLFKDLIITKNKIIKELALPDASTELSLSLLLQLLLINLNRSKKTEAVSTIQSDDRAMNYFYHFKKLIKRFGHERRQVNFYAMEMNMSTVHLNRICRLVRQKTALEVIHEQVIQEAKKYLKDTTNTVAEIAYFLGFKDPAHFSKFFKKKERMAPGTFRKHVSLRP